MFKNGNVGCFFDTVKYAFEICASAAIRRRCGDLNDQEGLVLRRRVREHECFCVVSEW